MQAFSPSAGFGFVSFARYVVRGRVLSSARSGYSSGSLRIFAAREEGSFRSPKTSASVGQACWQAVTTSPSRTRRFSFSASIRARFTRWMQ